jgi:hypothetical protein
MEELFRFSVIRAATRSNAATVSLERPTAPPPAPTPTPSVPVTQVVARGAARPVISSSLPTFITSRVNLGPTAGTSQAPQPPKSFQDQLRDVVQNLAEQNIDQEKIWKRLEPIALEFILSQAHIILTNNLWTTLQDFLDSMRQALYNQPDISQLTGATFSRSFQELRSQPSLLGYQLDLADLFIALLIIRRGGPSNLDAVIRSRKLWDATELLSDNPTLQEIADRIRIIDLIKAGPAALSAPADAKTPADIKAATQAAFETAMNKTLLFPPTIFAPLRKPVHGVGFREFHVVKQHIRRYEMAEIGRIENILKGESRDHSQKHTLSNERDTFLQTVTTTETDKELTSTDHVDIKNETQNQVKEDTKVDGGVHAQYDGGSFHLQADLTVSYDRSTDDTKKFSSDVAKDVTQKSVNKVTQQVTQSQTTKIIETFEETEDQSFDNKTGPGHVSGVYQWVEKVYLAQVFSLGRHMLLDIMVPEPAASLLAVATLPPPDPPIPPDPLSVVKIDAATNQPALDGSGQKILEALAPDRLTDDPSDPTKLYFAEWVAKFQVTGVDPAPAKYLTVPKSIATNGQGDVHSVLASDTIQIPDGYETARTNVIVTWLHDVPTTGGAPSNVDVAVGLNPFHFDEKSPNHWDRNEFTGSASAVYDVQKGPVPEQGQLAVTIAAQWVDYVAVEIEVVCSRTDRGGFAKWQLATYEKIAARWQQLQVAYEDKMAALKMQRATVGPLGAADPQANRLTERIELKRACVAILDNANETVRGVSPNVAMQEWPYPKPTDANSPDNPVLPEPILPFRPNPQNNKTTQELGAGVRWFEQAFEWENIAYVSYPYFWGRRQTWIQRLNLKNDDPLFLNFLQAGYARVVIPVRLGFEWAVHFYLHTGLPWLGGGLPPIGDKTQNPLYLDIAEEIKALTGGGEAKETQTPVGEPWEYILPTTLIKLRKDDALPEWSRLGPDGKPDPKNFPSDEPNGPWTWVDGPPKP